MTIKLTKEELQRFRDVRIQMILSIPDNGRIYRMPCPIHGGKNDNFAVYPENNYHCFKCNVTGHGAIDFCMALGYSFEDTLKELVRYI